MVGRSLGDRYRLVKLLGGGAMGSVFEATADGGHDHFAIKTLTTQTKTPRDAAERRARFVREAAVCATIDHPNVLRVLDHGIDAATDTPFLVMPLLDGEDLSAALARAGPLAPEVAAALFAQACEGLAAAHAAGVIHRDIKPSNLFLQYTGKGPICLKVADFGLAKVDDAVNLGLTTSGAFMGTAQYVSPEQATNAKHVDGRSDVWSLAMTMYHALAGKPAFAQTGSFLALVLELTGASGVRPLQDAAPWIDPRLARVVHGALLRDLALRCPSAVELALALRMAVGADVADARPTAASLTAVSPERRSDHAPRAELPTSWDDLLRS